MFFIILTTAITLHAHGVTNPLTSREVAEALRPLAGDFSYWLYTLGLLGVGFLAVPTLTGLAAYAFAELFRWRQGLDEKLNKAQSFYGVVLLSTTVAVLIDLAGDQSDQSTLLDGCCKRGACAVLACVYGHPG